MANEFIIRNGFISKSGSTVQSTLNISGNTTSPAFVTVGGTSSQFVKGDGSLDSNAYSLTGHTHVGLSDDYVTGATFNTGNGILTLTRQSGSTVTVDLDDRYSLTGHTHDFSAITNTGHTHTVSQITDFPTNVSYFTNDIGYLTAYTDTNIFVTGSTFNTGDGILEFTNTSGGTVNVDLDGRYLTGQTYTLTATQRITPTIGTFTNTGNYSTIGGGNDNSVADTYSFIGSGSGSTISSAYGFSSIVGGKGNKVGSSSYNHFIGGGSYNTVSNYYNSGIGSGKNNTVNAIAGFIGAGRNNIIGGGYAFIGSGKFNSISGSYSAAIVGGRDNSISSYSSYAFIGGGQNNTISGTYGTHNVIGGGSNNIISGGTYGHYNVINGGGDNTISALYGSYNVINGGGNTISAPYGSYNVINGGGNNTISGTYGSYNVINGGSNNILSGGTHSFIAGGNKNNVGHSNTFVLGSNITTTQINTTYVQNLIANGNVTATGIGMFGGSTVNDGKINSQMTSGVAGWAQFAQAAGVNNWTGWYMDGSNNFSLQSYNGANVKTLQLSSSGTSYFNGGNVGIGATNPLYPLHIGTSDGSGNHAYMWNTNATLGGLLFQGNTTSFDLIGYNQTTFNNILLRATTQAAYQFVVHTNGNIGIGQETPAYKLDVSGTGRFTNDLTITNNSATPIKALLLENTNFTAGNGSYIQFDSSDYVRLTQKESLGDGTFTISVRNSSSLYDMMTFRGLTQRVGINNTNPSYTLDVTGTGRFSDELLIRAGNQPNSRLTLNNTSSTGNRSFSLVAGIDSIGQNGFSIFDSAAVATRFVVHNSGNISIGNVSDSGYKLDVTGTTRIADTFTLNTTPNQPSETTALMIDGSGIVGTRELGSGAFVSSGTGVYTYTATQRITPTIGTFTNTTDYSTIGGGTGNTITISNSFTAENAYYNAIGGGFGNIIDGTGTASGAYGNSNINGYNYIGGGLGNRVGTASGYYGTGGVSSIVGGSGNYTDLLYSFIGGGSGNTMSFNYGPDVNRGSSIVGGLGNNMKSSLSFIGGGRFNTMSNKNAYNSFIGGGQNNSVSSYYGFIGGGRNNSITEYDTIDSLIVGGQNNSIIDTFKSAIVGGQNNNITNSSHYGFIGGGVGNSTSGFYGTHSFIGGGLGNTISGAYGYCNVINGGGNNTISGTYGSYKVIGGGSNNIISGGTNYSFIAGGQQNKVGHSNTFVLGSNITTTQINTTYVESLKLSTIISATTDTDRFLVSDGGVVKYRTGAQVLSDIGAASPGGVSGDIQYNNAGSFGGFGQVNTYTIDLDKPLLLEPWSSHPDALSTGAVAYDDGAGYGRPKFVMDSGCSPVPVSAEGQTPNVFYSAFTVTANTTYTVSWNLGGCAFFILQSNCTIQVTSIPDGASGTILVKQDATGSRTVTWTNGLSLTNIIIGSTVAINAAANKYSTVTYKRFGSFLIWVYGQEV